MNSKLKEINEEGDLFYEGMNSLDVLRLVRSLNQETDIKDIEPSMVYLNPSISKLAQAALNASDKTQVSEAEKRYQRASEVLKTLQTYQQDVDSLVDALSPVPVTEDMALVQKHTVILTGSTGSIGSYILRSLMKSSFVEQGYCLNRNEDSKALQKERNAIVDESLPQDISDSRLTFLHADLEAETLGLRKQMYETLRSKTTMIVHNAWPVDFKLPLSSFIPHLSGVVNLIILSAAVGII